MSLLLDKIFSSVALGHFIVDVMNGQRAVLLAFLSGPLGLSNTVLGLVSTLYIMSGALSQPAFGWLSDRIGPRWVAAGGVLSMALFFSLALVASGPLVMVFLMLASLGSGAFHPAGTMQATLTGRNHYAGRETTSAAYFFFFGQAGGFLGPILGGPILDRFGPSGLLLLSCLAFPVGMNAAQQLRYSLTQTIVRPLQTAGAAVGRPGWNGRLLPILAFAMLTACQAWSQQNMITFLPKYLHDLGRAAAQYGLIVALFMGGSALGNATGGVLADRFGKRRVAVAALSLAAVPIYIVSAIGWSPWLFLLALLAGFTTGSVHSILVVLAQRHIPGGMALASGLILGFMFTSGALGTLATGFLADLVGFPPVFRMTAAIALAGSLLALTIKEK